VIPRRISKRIDRRLRVFLQAAATATPILEISKLQIDDNEDDATLANGPRFGLISPEILNAALPSLRHITCLDIPIGENNYERGSYTSFRLADLLRGLPNLEKFALLNSYCDRRDRLDVANVLDAISSSRLQSIYLEHCLYRRGHFESFLERHSTTLRKVRMDKSYLIGCTFKELFSFMRNRLSLNELVLECFIVPIGV
jgi:hypothetical protein